MSKNVFQKKAPKLEAEEDMELLCNYFKALVRDPDMEPAFSCKKQGEDYFRLEFRHSGKKTIQVLSTTELLETGYSSAAEQFYSTVVECYLETSGSVVSFENNGDVFLSYGDEIMFYLGFVDSDGDLRMDDVLYGDYCLTNEVSEKLAREIEREIESPHEEGFVPDPVFHRFLERNAE